MTDKQFRAKALAARLQLDGKTWEACRMVLVDGVTAYKAFQAVGIDQGAISRALAKVREAKPARVCPCCGQPLK